MLKEMKRCIIFGFRTFHLNVPRPPENGEDSTAELRRRRHGDTRHSTVPPGAPEWEEGGGRERIQSDDNICDC